MYSEATISRLAWVNMPLDLLGEQWLVYSSPLFYSIAAVGLDDRITHILVLERDSDVIGVSALVVALVVRSLYKLHLEWD